MVPTVFDLYSTSSMVPRSMPAVSLSKPSAAATYSLKLHSIFGIPGLMRMSGSCAKALQAATAATAVIKSFFMILFFMC